ncbi:hypothetical protein MRX96_037828 [Rhipicephalus microplus]
MWRIQQIPFVQTQTLAALERRTDPLCFRQSGRHPLHFAKHDKWNGSPLVACHCRARADCSRPLPTPLACPFGYWDVYSKSGAHCRKYGVGKAWEWLWLHHRAAPLMAAYGGDDSPRCARTIGSFLSRDRTRATVVVSNERCTGARTSARTIECCPGGRRRAPCTEARKAQGGRVAFLIRSLQPLLCAT